MITQENLNKLRLQCEIFLMAGKTSQALEVYERILEFSSDPFVYTAKAKLLECLNESSKSLEAFKKALELTSDDNKNRLNILRAILELEESDSGILKLLAEKNWMDHPTQHPILKDPGIQQQDGEKTEIVSQKVEQSFEVAKNSGGFSASDIKTEIGLEKPFEPSPETKEDMPKRFGRYQILKKLGEGGMGIVYKACDLEMGRIVAIKVIGGKGDFNPQQAHRFLKEVKATAKLSHPNIVSIYDFGDSPQHYFTMEYIEGKTLGQQIQEGIFHTRKAAKVLQNICLAIECAHKAQVIHRDLKPGNIMLDKAGNIKVMDFGLAKFLGSESNLSRTGDIVGTPTYMPPEQAMGILVDERSDVYSIGAVGYEMITGRPIFQGQTLFNILHQVSDKEPLRPQSINTNIDIEIETIIMKCLEKAPEKRYQSAAELREELTRYLENRPILAKPPTPLARIIKWTKRNKEISAAIAAIVISILTVFFYVVYQWQRQVKHNLALNIIHEVMQWDKAQVDYGKEVQPQFKKAESLSTRDIVYQKWGLFCFQYAQAQIHQARSRNGTICQEDLANRNRYYAEAMDKFSKAFRCNKSDYISLYYMLFMLYAQQKNEQAYSYEDMLSKIIKKLNPESGLKYQTLAVEEMNQSYSFSGEEKKLRQEIALHDYSQALRYDPELPCSHNGLGMIYCGRKEYKLAQKHLDRCIELVPTYRYAYVNRGRMYLQQGEEIIAKGDTQASIEKFNLAIKDFKTVLDLDPSGDVYYKQVTAGDVYYDLAKLYSLLQEKDKSLQNLKEAISHGFVQFNKFKEDPAFYFLRNTQEFHDLTDKKF